MGSLMLLLVVVVLALSSTCRQSLVEFLKKMKKKTYLVVMPKFSPEPKFRLNF